MRLSLVIIPAALLALAAECFGAPVPPMDLPDPGTAPVDESSVIHVATNESGVVVKYVAVEKIKYLQPEATTIRLKFFDRMDTNALYTIDYSAPRQHAFAGWEIIEGGAVVGGSAPTNKPLKGVAMPLEAIAMPLVQGDHLVCIWDDAAQDWRGWHPYDHSGSYLFQVPVWGQWYWIGLWDIAGDQFVSSRWIGHFPPAGN